MNELEKSAWVGLAMACLFAILGIVLTSFVFFGLALIVWLAVAVLFVLSLVPEL